MKKNIIINLLTSLPVILITLYFIPFLGICLLLFKYFISEQKKRNLTLIYIISIRLLILVPKCINLFLDLNKIPYLKDIINSNLYNINFINYSKRIISVGVIFLILSYILQSLIDKIGIKLKNYIQEKERKNNEILKQNDMEIKLKQERAKTTYFTKCPTCGADNKLTEKAGKCVNCRKMLVNKNFKE